MTLKITFEFETVDAAMNFLVSVGGVNASPRPVVVERTMEVEQEAKPEGASAAAERPEAATAAVRDTAVESTSAPQPAPSGAASPYRKPRRPRSDKGTKREPYGPHQPVVMVPTVPEPAPEPHPAVAEPKAEVPAAEASALLSKVFDEKGIMAAREVLARNGVKRFGEVTPEQYVQLAADCKTVLAGGTI